MKVILLQDIARMGRKYEVKQVPDGHAQNYLIPRKLVLPATPQNLKWQSEHAARRGAAEAETAELFTTFLAHADSVPIVISVVANEQGHLFKGLGAVDIAKELSHRTGIMLTPSAIELARPIKEVGAHEVVVAVGSKQSRVTIIVEGKK